MVVIARKVLREYGIANPDAKEQIDAWYAEATDADWKTPADVKEKYRSASILQDGRVVFNICGNKYRLVVWINFAARTIYIRFIGTHKEYDKIDVQTV